jgi:HD-GYP domain-containing protein (c-di-GMP phosphodiesterase class II)/DNA-binding CsgD family transcriptional regulator
VADPLIGDRVRAADVIATLSLATDLAIGVPLEHGLQSTLIAMRLAESLEVDQTTARHTYYGCLLFYVGCTATAETASEIFRGEDALTTYATPGRFGSRIEMITGLMRALAPPNQNVLERAGSIALSLPKLVREFRAVVAATCEVAELLAGRLGLPNPIPALLTHTGERWDGKGEPGHVRGNGLPLPMRIVQVARDAAFQSMLGGMDYAVRVVDSRAGGAFDPVIAAKLVDEAEKILGFDPDLSVWEQTLASEPDPTLILEGEAIDRALAAMGDFADLASHYLAGHSSGVAELVTAAAERARLPAEEVAAIRRAALVHDLGRLAVPLGIWHKSGSLSQDDWERVRLHAYHTERILSRSPFLAALSPIATAHHERLDASGYHRGALAAAQPRAHRFLAAADACHAMSQPRPHRAALAPARVAEILNEEARAGRLDADAVAAVLGSSGLRSPTRPRPVALTEREAEVIGLLSRGLQTKQIARSLQISAKTADRHIQNVYRKIGVSTRAAATLFAMEHGLVPWGELPISS